MTPRVLWAIVVFTKNSNRLSLIDSPMAGSHTEGTPRAMAGGLRAECGSPNERMPRAMLGLGLSQIFINFQSSSKQSQTRGQNTPRLAERFGR